MTTTTTTRATPTGEGQPADRLRLGDPAESDVLQVGSQQVIEIPKKTPPITAAEGPGTPEEAPLEESTRRSWEGLAGIVADEERALRVGLGAVVRMYDFMDEHVEDRGGMTMERVKLARFLTVVARRLSASVWGFPLPAGKNARKKRQARNNVLRDAFNRLEDTFAAIELTDGLDYNHNRLYDLMDHGDVLRELGGFSADDKEWESVFDDESGDDDSGFAPSGSDDIEHLAGELEDGLV
jgi:hypothetical protein